MTLEVKEWNGMGIVRISSVPNPKALKKWLRGQTVPLVEDDHNPFDWCYEWDYQQFMSGKNAVPFD